MALDPRLRGGDKQRRTDSLTPGAQVAAAIEVLTAIDTGDRPADDVAADYFRRRRYIGAKDRVQIAGLLRRRSLSSRAAKSG